MGWAGQLYFCGQEKEKKRTNLNEKSTGREKKKTVNKGGNDQHPFRDAENKIF